MPQLLIYTIVAVWILALLIVGYFLVRWLWYRNHCRQCGTKLGWGEVTIVFGDSSDQCIPLAKIKCCPKCSIVAMAENRFVTFDPITVVAPEEAVGKKARLRYTTSDGRFREVDNTINILRSR